MEVERAAHQGREESSTARGIVCSPSLMGPPLYSGEGVHLAPPPRHLGWRPRDEEPRAAVARVAIEVASS
jgi:hypothetical protein